MRTPCAWDRFGRVSALLGKCALSVRERERRVARLGERRPKPRRPRAACTSYCVLFSRAGVAVCTSQAQTLAWMATHASERRERRSRAALDLPVPASCSLLRCVFKLPSFARPASKLKSHVITTSDIIQTRVDVEHLKKTFGQTRGRAARVIRENLVYVSRVGCESISEAGRAAERAQTSAARSPWVRG